jgi:hypothetical protein
VKANGWAGDDGDGVVLAPADVEAESPDPAEVVLDAG